MFWLMPWAYRAGAHFYWALWGLLLHVKNFTLYLGRSLKFIKYALFAMVNLLWILLVKAVSQLLVFSLFVIKCLWSVFFWPSWLHFAYVYFCLEEVIIYWSYCIKCYWWWFGVIFSDLKYWALLWPNLFVGWMHFYFIYGFLFTTGAGRGILQALGH